jgi:hypothetical protein
MRGKPKWKYTEMARRFARAHLPASAWTDKDIKALADLLGHVRTRAYGNGFNDGYGAGHEDQMRMRVQDAMEREAGRRAPRTCSSGPVSWLLWPRKMRR